ncbi:arabinan endo-1,5-alpha-L-arabinosidase [Deinococcus deserti]
MYYAASPFGTRNSAIGVASSTNPCATGTWTDHGPILRSSSTTTDDNAIDPNVHWDSTSGWWKSWGSFFGGIKIQHMSSMTTFDGPTCTIASRPGVANNPVEAPSTFKRGKYHYLFASWDSCCKGLDSTYKTVVGRATSITGPYSDKNGVRLDQGGEPLYLTTGPTKSARAAGKRQLLLHTPLLRPQQRRQPQNGCQAAGVEWQLALYQRNDQRVQPRQRWNLPAR